MRLASGVVIIALLALDATAFQPAADTQEPVTARIEGPVEVTTKAPFPVYVTLKNDGATRIKGTVRLAVIDGWRVEPEKAKPFSLRRNGSAHIAFRVIPGGETYNAHYPVHAFVEFNVKEKRYTAHPILILETRLPAPPRHGTAANFDPIEVRNGAGVALWRAPVHRVVFQVFGKPPRAMPAGWQGSEEATKGYALFGPRIRRGAARETITVHPPWYPDQAGTMLVEFPLRLPVSSSIRLRFANAIRDHHPEQGEPPSDGVTFRVRVVSLDAPEGEMGAVLFEKHTAAKTWQDGEVDLSRYAGQAIRLQLEAHPGPEKNTTCDGAYWAEPLLLAGSQPEPGPFPPPAAAARRPLGTLHSQGERHEVFLIPGNRGLLDAAIGFSCKGRELLFQGFRVRVLGDALEQRHAASVLKGVSEEPSRHGYRLRHRFHHPSGNFDLLGELWTEHGVLKAKFWLENEPAPRPWFALYIEAVAAGSWSERASRVYAGPGNVIQEPEAFTLNFDGHRLSTSFVGFDFANGFALVQAVDVPPDFLEVEPKTRRYTLHTPHGQTLSFIPAANVWQAVKTWRETNGLKPAGGVHKLAGRFVFDLWGGQYAEATAALQRAFRYGLTDAVVVWHNWQRWGYDYRLPDIYPPNPDLGTFADFRKLARVCQERGVLFAPHDNYIDFYPDAEGYSYDHIAFTADRKPVRAWYNEWQKAQSYRWRADRVRPFLERNLKLIRNGFAPDAYFIDVWSSVGPYDYWTSDGQFVNRLKTKKIWGEAFAWIRRHLDGAPQISESGHDQLIGWLDGAQTNHLRVGSPPKGYYQWAVWPVRCADAERIPWFDAAHHDRFVLHGAGYESRYAAGLDSRTHGMNSDDYITTEALTGHPAMVAKPFGREVVRKYWLLHEVMRGLARQRIDDVEFAGADLHRQHVRWGNAGEVWVNRGARDWTVKGHRLPPYGFYARIPVQGGNAEAGIERRDGVIVEWARSPSTLYLNARPVIRGCRLAVESLHYAGGRNIALNLRWKTARPFSKRYRIFVHFTDAAGEIRFQGDHDPPTPTTEWTGTGETSTDIAIPKKYAPGEEFHLRVGLYHPDSGERPELEGETEGPWPIKLGTIYIEGKEGRVTGVTWKPDAAKPDPRWARMNPEGKAISFGAVRTNGACRLSRQGRALILTPLPESDAFTVHLRTHELPWKIPEPTFVEAVGEDGSTLWRKPLRQARGTVSLTCDPGVFAYRLR